MACGCFSIFESDCKDGNKNAPELNFDNIAHPVLVNRFLPQGENVVSSFGTPYERSLAPVQANTKLKRSKKPMSLKMVANEEGLSGTGETITPLPPPAELAEGSGLRQVICLLVLGQLADAKSVLRLCRDRGMSILATCKTDQSGSHLILGRSDLFHSGPDAATMGLIRDYVMVAEAFADIWRELKKEDISRIPGASLADGVLSAQMRVAEHATK